MKKFVKIFIVSFICFFLAFSLGSYAYVKINIKSNQKPESKLYVAEEKKKDQSMPEEEKSTKKDPIDTLEKAYEQSKRINFLLLGMEDTRTDTIIFLSFDPETKKVDLISIPRDTYLHRKGYNLAEERKINSIYYSHGVNGTVKAVQYVLAEVPIHHYAMIDYSGVEKIVDSIGGVEVNIPFHMRYKDPTSKPPLYINIPKGKQVLDGKKAIQFLRFRKGNGKRVGYEDGDLGRIKAQQEFIKSFINKSLSFRLPIVIKTCFDNVKTNVKFNEMISYGKDAIGINGENLTLVTLPGEGVFKTFKGKTLSYFVYDPLKTKEIMEKIYGVEKKVP